MSVKIKICGICTTEDALVAADAGADFVGMIFEPESPRHVDCARALKIANALSAKKVRTVGVFVNQDADFICRAVDNFGLYAVQLHGDKCARYENDLRGCVKELWKVFWPSSIVDVECALASKADRVLIDSRVGNAVGGTGLAVDFKIAAMVSKHRSVVLAGGLNPENFVSAMRGVNPWCLDFNSGLEMSHGVKSPEKIKLLFDNLKKYETGKYNTK